MGSAPWCLMTAPSAARCRHECVRGCADDCRWAPGRAGCVDVSVRLLVGRRDGGLPDRGRDQGRRAQPFDLGHVLRHPGQGGRRRHRRAGDRPLPPLRGGCGADGPAGAGFYDRLVDELLSVDVRPVLTLYHWDLPQELEDAGGWANRDTAHRFAEYTQLVAARLGDRVAAWTTLNEPWCSAFLGYASGEHAPGRTDQPAALAAAHHLLLAHGLGAQVLRDMVDRDSQVSLVLNLSTVRGIGSTPADQDAVRRVDGLLNRIFLDPVFHGRYPSDVLEDTAALTDWGFVRDGDLAAIATPIDVLGLNYYQPVLVGGGEPAGDQRPSAWPACDAVRFHQAPGPVTDMGWPVDPTGLRDLLLRLRRDYGDVPLLVTENGAAYADEHSTDGAVHDPERVAYLRSHLAATHEALREGVDVRGYFVWSLLYNFEWAYGYAKHFGIVHVDYRTQRRTWKDSAHWYREVISTGGLGNA